MFVRSLRSLWHDTHGSALVEATLVVPVLVFLFFGVYEFSWYFNRQQLVQTGIRDAARFLAAASIDPCSDGTLIAQAKNLAATGIIASGGSARVAGWAASNVTVPCPFSFTDNSTGAYNGPQKIYRVTVSTSFPDPSFGYFGLLGVGVPNITASHSERAIGGAGT